MKWKLWLDDQIHDPDAPARHCPPGFFGAASSNEALRLMLIAGPPVECSLDHDLGQDDTVRELLKQWQKMFPNQPPEIWEVHSANPLAKDWIDSFIISWKKSLAF